MLSRNLTFKEIVLWGGAGLAFMALVIGGQMLSTQPASPPRIPEKPSPEAYTSVDGPGLFGLTGESIKVEGELVAADFEYPDADLWVAGPQFGSDPGTGLPYAMRLRVRPETPFSTDSANPITLRGYVEQLNLKRAPAQTVEISATVHVVGASAFVVRFDLRRVPQSTE